MLSTNARGLITVLAGALAVAAVAAGCGGGDGGGDGLPAFGERSSAGPIAAYLADAGLDGRRYALADPANCASLSDEAAAANEGRVCIDFAGGAFIRGEGTVEVEVVGSGERWELTLELLDDDVTWAPREARRVER